MSQYDRHAATRQTSVGRPAIYVLYVFCVDQLCYSYDRSSVKRNACRGRGSSTPHSQGNISSDISASDDAE